MNNLCTALHMLGRHARELEEAQRAEPLYPDPLNLNVLEVRALAALGRLGEVNRLTEASLSAAIGGTTPGDVLLEAAIELRAHGHRQASLELAGRAARWYRGRLDLEPENLTWAEGLLDALRWSERWEEAQAVCRKLVEKAPDDVRYRGMLGAFAARLGRSDEAVRIREELQRSNQPYLYGWHTYRCACVTALLGDKERSMDLLRQALAEGCNYGIHLHREIDLEPLWDYPPFQELLKPKG
jgi:tetratricopeptide (TPR) repeat protein